MSEDARLGNIAINSKDVVVVQMVHPDRGGIASGALQMKR